MMAHYCQTMYHTRRCGEESSAGRTKWKNDIRRNRNGDDYMRLIGPRLSKDSHILNRKQQTVDESNFDENNIQKNEQRNTSRNQVIPEEEE